MKKFLFIIIPLIFLSAVVFSLSPSLEKRGEGRFFRGIFSSFFSPLCPFCHSREGGNLNSAEAAPTRTGLVGWWTMDSGDKNGTNYYDRSGYNNTATSTGSPAIAAGKIIQAINLNGTTDYLTVADSASLSFGSGGTDGAFTLSAWVKPDVAGAAYIVGKEPLTTNNNREWLLLGYTDGKIYFTLYSLTGAARISITGPNTSLTAGQWHQVVATYDGTKSSNGMKIFVDTAQVNNATDNLGSYTGLTDTSSHVAIGAGDRQTLFHDGLIDDVRIYNRALSAAEIATLYSSAKVGYETASPRTSGATAGDKLVSWWTMDTNDMSPTGATLYDKSGLGNHGTVTGTTTSTGKIGQSRTFNGTSDRVVVSTVNISNSITASAWVYSTNFSDDMFIVEESPVNARWELFFENPFLKWRGGGSTAITCSPPSNNNWHHVVGTQTGTTATLYIDGTQCNSGTVDALVHSTGQIDIGAFTLNGGISPGYFFNGKIDDVRVYNYALSAQEISQLYNSAKASYSSGPSRTGLVGYWTMDTDDMSATGATLYDKSGSGNNGTVTGTTTSTGRINQARSFNGSSDKISLGDPSIDHFTSATPFTISAWIKPSNTTGGRIAGRDSTSTSRYFISLSATSLIMSGNITGATGGGYISGVAARVGEWSLVTMTYDGSGNLNGGKVYQNGVLSGTGANSAITGAVYWTNLFVGCTNGVSNFFNGSIDDVRIYNRALSAAEVANLYSSSRKTYMK